MSTNGGFGGAGGPSATAPQDGKPRTGGITLNFGESDTNPDSSNGYFLDPTPFSHAEFSGNILNPFTADPLSNLGPDFFSIVVAELTHVLGLISPRAGGEGDNWVGYELIDSGHVSATNPPIRDDSEGGGTSGYYYTFNGPTVDHLLTSFNSGDADDDSWGNAIHTAGGTADVTINGTNYRGTDDPGNAAGGNPERALPSWVTAHILADAYGYTIENPAKFGTFHTLKQADGTLRVRGLDNSDDFISIARDGDIIKVAVDLQNDVPGSGPFPGVGNYGVWVSEFDWADINRIVIDAGSGNDDVRIFPIGSDIEIVVNLGGQTEDELTIHGSDGTYDSFTVDFPAISSSGINITAFSGISRLTFQTNGGDADIYLPDIPGGLDIIDINATFDSEVLHLHSLDQGTEVDISTFDGDDTLHIGDIGTGNLQSIRSPVSFNGGGHYDYLAIHNDAATENWFYTLNPTDVTTTGPNGTIVHSHFDVDKIDIGGGYGTDVFSTTPGAQQDFVFYGGGGSAADIAVLRGGKTYAFFGGDGNDSVTIGSAVLAGLPDLLASDPGDGIDTLRLDDTASTSASAWTIYGDNASDPNKVYYGGKVYSTAGFENLQIAAGSGANYIEIQGRLTQNLSVHAGDGPDDVVLNKVDSWHIVYVLGVPVAVGLYDLNIVGGNDGARDTLTVNDATRNQGDFHYRLDQSSLFGERDGLAFDDERYDVDFSGFESLTVQSNNFVNNLTILGTPLLLPNEKTTFFLNGAADNVYVHPRDVAGNSTLLSRIEIHGGPAVDTLYVDDSASVSGAYFAVSNLLSAQAQSISVNGALPVDSFNDVEDVRLLGSQAADQFDIASYKNGSALRIEGNAGDDVVNMTPSNNLNGNITSISFFNFDGGLGRDTFLISNANNSSSWQYTRAVGSIGAYLGLGASHPYFVVLNVSQNTVEHVRIVGSPERDEYFITAAEQGTLTELYGYAGNDSYAFGSGFSTVGIQGEVSIVNSGGLDTILVDNFLGNGSTLHIANGSVGAAAGDNLFGPGGHLTFEGSFDLLTLRLSNSGADAVFASPNQSTSLNIQGNASAGDSLRLTVPPAINPASTPSGPGAGSYTFSGGYRPVTYSGFETASIGVAGDFDGNGSVAPQDHLVWKANFGRMSPPASADANLDGVVDIADYILWRKNLGASLPPSTSMVALQKPADADSTTQSPTANELDTALAAFERRQSAFPNADGRVRRLVASVRADVSAYFDDLLLARLSPANRDEYASSEAKGVEWLDLTSSDPEAVDADEDLWSTIFDFTTV